MSDEFAIPWQPQPVNPDIDVKEFGRCSWCGAVHRLRNGICRRCADGPFDAWEPPQIEYETVRVCKTCLDPFGPGDVSYDGQCLLCLEMLAGLPPLEDDE